MANTYDDNWRPSARDMHLINTGRKPAWAKKVTEIGPREKRLRTSNAPSEVAMRKVTEPDYRPPFSETDLKTVRQGEVMMNQRIADAIARKVDLNVDADADGITVADLSKSPVRFFIWSHGLDYVVKIIRSATEHDAIRCKSIKEVVDVINKNTIGEAMNVNKAKQILEQAGYVVENPQLNEDVDITLEDFNKKVWDAVEGNAEISQYDLIDWLDERQEKLVNDTIQNYWENDYWPHKTVEDNVDDCVQKIIDTIIDDM